MSDGISIQTQQHMNWVNTQVQNRNIKNIDGEYKIKDDLIQSERLLDKDIREIQSYAYILANCMNGQTIEGFIQSQATALATAVATCSSRRPSLSSSPVSALSGYKGYHVTGNADSSTTINTKPDGSCATASAIVAAFEEIANNAEAVPLSHLASYLVARYDEHGTLKQFLLENQPGSDRYIDLLIDYIPVVREWEATQMNWDQEIQALLADQAARQKFQNRLTADADPSARDRNINELEGAVTAIAGLPAQIRDAVANGQNTEPLIAKLTSAQETKAAYTNKYKACYQTPDQVGNWLFTANPTHLILGLGEGVTTQTGHQLARGQELKVGRVFIQKPMADGEDTKHYIVRVLPRPEVVVEAPTCAREARAQEARAQDVRAQQLLSLFTL